MEGSSKVFTLKLIWRLFSNAGALWVAWTRHYLIRQSSFWDISEKTTRGSWMWKNILKFRPLAATFLKTKIRDGASTRFWFDKWLSIAPLIDLAGELGTRILGINRNTKVSDQLHVPVVSTGHDLVLWNKYETVLKANSSQNAHGIKFECRSRLLNDII
ncbi:unnamed protein product [Arabis nemorensis]|uniref:Reverse transcriptase zinc-binding domain-containing protein n=1 Tax=Arabis nemorensis TaxID=586526 RepID=A0A565BBJ7_9BRAS|nr:unnamed protein product [Arabis nemorensis]